MPRTGKLLVGTFAWTAAIALAALLDYRVAWLVRDSGIDQFLREHTLIRETIKAPGSYYFTLGVVIVVFIIHPGTWRTAGFVALGTLISGVNGLFKWIFGRTRPWKIGTPPRLAPFVLSPFRDGWVGLTEGKNLCFPSGHACLAFATATALAMLWPRTQNGDGYSRSSPRWWPSERVLENAHWLSDVVAGAAAGIGGVHVIRLDHFEGFYRRAVAGQSSRRDAIHE